jgi:hypothetical protein
MQEGLFLNDMEMNINGIDMGRDFILQDTRYI